MKEKKLSVRLYGEPAGILEQLPTGKMIFTYEHSAHYAISSGMPIRREPYDHARCEAFFGGLLPESDTAKKALGKIYGISAENSFALLKSIGYDCAGAISFHDVNDPVTANNIFTLEGKNITENELYTHIKALPKKPLFQGFEGLRLSLAGVHDKAAVCVIDGKIAMPVDGCPTTHILKPTSTFEGMVENEFVCMQLASQVGLTVPDVEIRKIKDIAYLLVQRYDRRERQGKIERIHQEDFCQAFGILSARKYQNEGGPGFKESFELMNNTIQPAIGRNMLMSGTVFNYLIGNMDAHGKNFSLLHLSESQLGLAPFYDMLCTRFYPELTTKMAMKIGSQYEADQVYPRHWEQLCENINYSYPALKRLIKNQGATILKALEKNSEFYREATGRPDLIKQLGKTISNNITRILAKFA